MAPRHAFRVYPDDGEGRSPLTFFKFWNRRDGGNNDKEIGAGPDDGHGLFLCDRRLGGRIGSSKCQQHRGCQRIGRRRWRHHRGCREASDPVRLWRCAVAASSQAAVDQLIGSGWEFAITPYLWASGTKAKIDTPQGENIKVDESFTDILDALKFAMMGAFEAKHGRFVSVHDLMYLSLGSSARGDGDHRPDTGQGECR